MNKLISLSLRSKKLLGPLSQQLKDPILSAWNQQDNESIDQSDLLAWLSEKKEDVPSSRFLLESFRASLLEDLEHSFLIPSELRKKKKEAPVSWSQRASFLFLTIAGTTLAFSEGFDAIASILGSFAAVPTGVLFLAGIGFSLLSVGIFYFVDLVEIANTFGVKLGKSTELLDVFLKQVEHIRKLKKRIADCYDEETTDATQRQALQQMLAMLIARDKELDEARNVYLTGLNSPGLKVAKYITAAITAMFFFGGGFLTGQTLALAVAGLFVATASATFWPVVVASAMVGLAALALYWFIQRPALDNTVGHWVGLDKERVDAFTDDEMVAEERADLHKLSRKIERLEHASRKKEQYAFFEVRGSQPIPEKLIQERGEKNTHHHRLFGRQRSYSLNDLSDHGYRLGVV